MLDWNDAKGHNYDEPGGVIFLLTRCIAMQLRVLL